MTQEKLKEIFSKYGEVKSVKISKYILVTKINDEFKEIETSHGFGYVCYTLPDAAQKAIAELNEKKLPGYENSKRPVIISLFMPKYERKQILTKIQTSNNQTFNFPMPMAMPGMPQPFIPPYPNMPYPRPQRNPDYRKAKKQPQPQPQQNQSVSSNKDDEPNYKYLESLETDEQKRDYLGEYLFKKIEQHPIAHSKSFTVDTISRITGMILGIGNIKEIYDITVNYESITARINEALSLLEQSQ